ncbi:MAG: HNH endonuclease [Dolichospermum sp.]|nr:HNH endonuclease [Dolichospermum sp.]
MIWKDIKGFEGYYTVNDSGEIKNMLTGKILKQSNSNGYRSVRLTKDKKRSVGSVHRIVASSFLDLCDKKKEVNHRNGLKNDNRIENLEWCNRKENVDHSIKHGLVNYAKKLDEFKVLAIHTFFISGKNLTEISKLYGISVSTVHEIVNNKTWKNVRV